MENEGETKEERRCSSDCDDDALSNPLSSDSGEGFEDFRKKAQGQRVYELERQLQIAETRSGTLKQQVEYMRMLYAGVKDENEEDDAAGEVSNMNVAQESPNPVKITLTVPKLKAKTAQNATGGNKGADKKRVGVAVSELKERFERGGSKGKQPKGQPHNDPTSKSNEAFQDAKRVRTASVGVGPLAERRGRRKRTVAASRQQQSNKRADADTRSEVPARTKFPKKKTQPAVEEALPPRMESDMETEPGQFELEKPRRPMKFPGAEGDAEPEPDWHERRKFSDPVQQSCQMNYQMPTVSSELKRVNGRSFLKDFNFRNIPFVAGQSTGTSYNLGLRIQETLSLLKLKGALSSLPLPTLDHQHARRFDQTSATTLCYPTNREDFHKMCEDMLVEDSQASQTGPVGLPSSSSAILPHELLQPETKKIMKKVLERLYNDFSALAKDYDEAKRDLNKARQSTEEDDSETKSIQERLEGVAKALELKEDEINAILLLYKEVKKVKTQLQQLNARGSVSAISCTMNGLLNSMWPTTNKGYYYKATFKLMTFLHRLQDFQGKLKGNI